MKRENDTNENETRRQPGDRREQNMRYERDQQDKFAAIAYEILLKKAAMIPKYHKNDIVNDNDMLGGGGSPIDKGVSSDKIDFDAVSRLACLAGKVMMRHRREFSRDYQIDDEGTE
jgi:hypothetical protein